MLFLFGISFAQECVVTPPGLSISSSYNETFSKEEIDGVISAVRACGERYNALKGKLLFLKKTLLRLKSSKIEDLLNSLSSVEKDITGVRIAFRDVLSRFYVDSLCGVAVDSDKLDILRLTLTSQRLVSKVALDLRDRLGVSGFVPDGISSYPYGVVNRVLLNFNDSYSGRMQCVFVYLCRLYPYSLKRLSVPSCPRCVALDLMERGSLGSFSNFLSEVLSPSVAESVVKDVAETLSMWRDSLERERNRRIGRFKNRVLSLYQRWKALVERRKAIVRSVEEERKSLSAMYRSLGFNCGYKQPERCLKSAVAFARRKVDRATAQLSSFMVPVYAVSDDVKVAYYRLRRTVYEKGLAVSKVWVYPYKSDGSLKYLVVIFPAVRR